MITIDLSGPLGNAFYLLGLASKLGSKIGMSETEIKETQEQMKAGDYENLVNVFEDVFKDEVILIRY